METDIIQLNVGGVKYDTTRTTIKEGGTSMLSQLISGGIPTALLHGRIFIDRDGQLFAHILNYLRNTENWTPPTTVDSTSLKREAEYYGLMKMAEMLQVKLVEVPKPTEIPKHAEFPIVLLSLCYDIDNKSASIDLVPRNLSSLDLNFKVEKNIDYFRAYSDIINNVTLLHKMGYRLITHHRLPANARSFEFVFQLKD